MMTRTNTNNEQEVAPGGWAIGGSLIGVFLGYVIGSPYGAVAGVSIIFVVGLAGAVLANEFEYQWLRRRYSDSTPREASPWLEVTDELENLSVEDEESSDTIQLSIKESSGMYTVLDATSGIVSQGETREEAMRMFAEAMELTKEVEEDEDEAEIPNAPWFSSDGSPETA